jgi:DNA replication regulator DPB11
VISEIRRLFLVVPYCHPFADIPSVEHLEPSPEIVTDMWAERCLQCKKFIGPDEHVLSRPISVFPIPGFERLSINSTGVADMELLHVSKAIKVLGARYDQVLKTGISVLLCNPSKAGEEKLRHADEWHIPAVSIEWLWDCIRHGQMQPFREYLLKNGQTPDQRNSALNAVAPPRRPEPTRAKGQEQLADNALRAKPVQSAKYVLCQKPLSKANGSNQALKAQKSRLAPGEGFAKSPRRKGEGSKIHKSEHVPLDPPAAIKQHEPKENGDCEAEDVEMSPNLQEMSARSPPKAEKTTSPRKARLFRQFDGEPAAPSRDQDDTPSAPEATSTGKTAYLPPRSESIHGAIQELLSKSKAKNTTPMAPNGDSKKKRLLGRALSNMSNSSREGTNVRASRASSIDSINTEGLGSVILDEASQSRRNSSSLGRRGSFTGRAPVQERGIHESALELGDAALYREQYQEETEETPQMTQLGYDNPDDAVALRELLAERRRKRTRKGQENNVKAPDAKDGKRIKDDVSMAPASWGAGRRTRQKAKSP